MGKRYAALHVAYAIASGGTVFGWNAPQPSPVLYVDGEMPFSAMQERIASIVQGAGQEPPSASFLRVLTPDLQGDCPIWRRKKGRVHWSHTLRVCGWSWWTILQLWLVRAVPTMRNHGRLYKGGSLHCGGVAYPFCWCIMLRRMGHSEGLARKRMF